MKRFNRLENDETEVPMLRVTLLNVNSRGLIEEHYLIPEKIGWGWIAAVITVAVHAAIHDALGIVPNYAKSP